MSHRRAGHRRLRQLGQGLVEFALVAPLFFLLLFAIIEFGRVVYYVQMLNNATREGARYAIVHGADSTCPSGPLPGGTYNACDPTGAYVKDAVKDAAIAIIDAGPSDFVVTVCWVQPGTTYTCPAGNSGGDYGKGNNGRGQAVDVRVAYTYRAILEFIPVPPFTVSGGSTLVVNH